jgi:hypothetical protein
MTLKAGEQVLRVSFVINRLGDFLDVNERHGGLCQSFVQFVSPRWSYEVIPGR